MLPQDGIKDFLEEVSQEYPDYAINKLKKGSTVRKSAGCFYEIDDPNLLRLFADSKKCDFPYNQIHSGLEPSAAKILNLFKDSSTIPFSRAVNARIGECVEKGILTQLWFQELTDSYYIPGILYEDGFAADHAFNVVIATNDAIKGKPFLIDTQNPFYKSEQIIHPYIAEITGYEKGDFLVPDEWKARRIYALRRRIDLI